MGSDQIDQPCEECGSIEFDIDDGKKICSECGTEVIGFCEIQSQELENEINISRYIHVDDNYEKPKKVSESKSSWTSYEAYNQILQKWTQSLLDLGATEHLKGVVYTLWVEYLNVSEVALCKSNNKVNRPSYKIPRCGMKVNQRDKTLLFEGKDVFTEDLVKNKSNFEIKEVEPKTKLQRLQKRFKGEQHGLGKTILSELSKTLDNMSGESSLSDNEDKEWKPTPDDLNQLSKTKKASKKKSKSSKASTKALSRASSKQSESDTQTDDDDVNNHRRYVTRRTQYVKNWLDKEDHIYVKSAYDDDTADSFSQISKAPTLDSNSEYYDDVTSGRTSRTSAYENGSLKNTTNQEFVNPSYLNLPKLLSILYLAVLLSEQDILLFDILRWCEEGYIPYKTAHFLLSPNMEMFKRDMNCIKAESVPTSDDLYKITGNIVVYLSLEKIPLVPQRTILQRFIEILNLPSSLFDVAITLGALFTKKNDELKPQHFLMPESDIEVAASIVVAMKLCFGLDGRSEYHINATALTINKILSDNNINSKLFSWTEWMRYMQSMFSFCDKVYPQFKNKNYDCKRLISKFWSEDIWKLSIPSTGPRNHLLFQEYTSINDINIEKQVNNERLFKPSKDPFKGMVKQYIDFAHQNDKGEDKEKLIKIGKELLNISFKEDIFAWCMNFKKTEDTVAKADSTIQLKKHICSRSLNNKSKEKSKCRFGNYCCKIPYDYHELNEKRNNKQILVLQPQNKYWSLRDPELNNTNRDYRSFDMLVYILSELCQTREVEITRKIKFLEKWFVQDAE